MTTTRPTLGLAPAAALIDQVVQDYTAKYGLRPYDAHWLAGYRKCVQSAFDITVRDRD